MPKEIDGAWSLRINGRTCALGLSLVLLSFFMPLLFNVHNFGVLRVLERALWQREKLDLLMAALRLVLLNSLRGIPHYVGAFFIGTSIEIRRGERHFWFANMVLMPLVLFVTYQGIELVHHIRYDFGLPAVAVTALVLIFGRLDHQYISPVKKVVQIIFFLTAFQFLDIMPIMRTLPVGRGETSFDIKLAAFILESEELLDLMGMAGFLILLLFGIMMFFQFREENSLRQVASLQKQNEEIRTQARLQEMENRTHQEMQHLVHDLKSPLAAMQPLVGLLKMEAEAKDDPRTVDYLGRIENGIVQISRMISEILYEDQRTAVTTQEILDTSLAQISVTNYAPYVLAQNDVPAAVISVNRFLFPRALINLTQNSAQAIPPGREASIRLHVARVERGESAYIRFAVSDNGRGIRPDVQEHMWQRNVSGTNSSGLGLHFVRKVVEGLHGEIELKSTPFEGTTIALLIPEEEPI